MQIICIERHLNLLCQHNFAKMLVTRTCLQAFCNYLNGLFCKKYRVHNFKLVFWNAIIYTFSKQCFHFDDPVVHDLTRKKTNCPSDKWPRCQISSFSWILLQLLQFHSSSPHGCCKTLALHSLCKAFFFGEELLSSAQAMILKKAILNLTHRLVFLSSCKQTSVRFCPPLCKKVVLNTKIPHFMCCT